MNDFRQVVWNADLEAECRQLARLALNEDLAGQSDWTSVAVVPEAMMGRAFVVARKAGTIAGLPAAGIILDEYDRKIAFRPLIDDGTPIAAGTAVAEIAGPARSLLAAERPLLNLLGQLSGIATLTSRFVEAVADTAARIYDTRKTTLGWRRLEKYAVRIGGGHNHRLGLFDGVLIKDNHLALGAIAKAERFSPADAVGKAREFLAARSDLAGKLLVEIEVDSLAQLREVLPGRPDIVLLDNMSPATLREAVALRDSLSPGVELEASGGISLETVGAVARSGVDRISAGALTHSAEWLDVGLDWQVAN